MRKVIETERLMLRELMISEAELFLKNYTDYKKNGFGRWAVILKEANKFVGWCGLKLNEEELIDLGFRFFFEKVGKRD